MAASTPVEAVTAYQVFVQLLPVIVGGVIGFCGGLGTTTLATILKSREDKRAIRRAKLELIVAHTAEIEHWAKRLRHQYLFEEGEERYEPSPSSKIEALTTVYFPDLHERARALDSTSDTYELEVMKLARKMLAEGTKAMAATKDALIAENPADTTIGTQMKLAAKQARIKAADDVSDIDSAYEKVLYARQNLLTAAQTLATKL